MKKTLIAAMAALTLIATPAFASLNQFFHMESGQWSIEGYTGDKNFCSAKSYWRDGSYVSLFNMKGSNTFSFIVHNSDWNMNGDIGSYYDARMIFSGKAGVDGGIAPFELMDSQTIAFREITDKFINSWVRYRNLEIVMPNDIPNMLIGLSGTSGATDAFVTCIEHLNN